MQIGAVLPQTEIGDDVGALRAWAQGVEALGYAHVLAYDHVLGADRTVHEGFAGPYDIDTTFHEPFVLFGFLAAVVDLELVTGVIILPQRQTALVAKQAAQVDLLTKGRFRLGVGVGWNRIEYDALDKPFEDRGVREEEQVELLRRLWTERSVTFDGRFEQVRGAGLAPMPVQRPIPIWLGGSSDPAYARAGRLADGWMPQVPPGPKLDHALAVIADAARSAGRDPSTIGMEAHVHLAIGGPDVAVEHAGRWREAGASHVCVSTMRAGLETIDDHLRALEQVAGGLGLRP